jgi:hypothetical protein
MNTDNTPQDIYGFPLLDNLHHLFPEILYDNTVFPHDSNDSFGRLLSWIRFRLANQYPQTFSRARQQYSQNMATERRNDYEEWLWLRSVRAAAPQRSVSTYPNMSRLQASLNTNFWGGEAQPLNTIHPNGDHHMDEDITTPPRINRSLSTGIVNQFLQNTLIDEILGSLIIPRTTTRTVGGTLWRFYDPVPIVPTAAEITAGSTILESNSITADTICAVCQEHDSPHNSPRDISGAGASITNGWRLLTNCQHKFHKDCIDRWFEGHVVCPVCRADIRITTNQPPSSGQSVAESVAESALSSPDL